MAIAVTDPNAKHLVGTKWIWLPKSKITIQRQSATDIVVTIPEWLARDKGLI